MLAAGTGHRRRNRASAQLLAARSSDGRTHWTLSPPLPLNGATLASASSGPDNSLAITLSHGWASVICDGRHEASSGQPGKLVIADATTLPGVPTACWLPIKPGLTVHGLRYGHKTWMAEDSIPEILAEQRLGHPI